MKFEKLIVKKPDKIGIKDTIQTYNKGTIHVRSNGVFVYWDAPNRMDVYTGTFIFEITTKEE